MALDGIFLFSLINEMKTKILYGRVDKVTQPEKDEIVLSIKNNRKTYKLLISSSAVYPKIHFTDIPKQNPMQPPMFCMVLRKYLNSSKIINIRQLGTDRIVLIDFESADEMGFNSVYTLIVEIMGRHSNITLVRERDNLIMDSIKHVTPEINSVRNLYPSIEFIYPPASLKLDPFNFLVDDLINYIENNNIKLINTMFSNIFTGVSRPFSKEIFYRLEQEENIKISLENINKIYSSISDIFNSICNKNFSFNCYIDKDTVKDFYCIDLYSLNNFKSINYEDPSMLIESFYFQKDKSDRLNSRSSDLQKLINLNIERCEKKIRILEGNLKDCSKKEKFQICGEILTANIYALKKGMSVINLLNYYTNKYMDIELDPNKTPSDNIQKYFKKYNKLKKTEVAAKKQIEITYDELKYLNSVLTSIKNADSYDDIEEIKRELIETGYIKFKKKNNKKIKNTKPLHFISSEGIDIYVGKNNIQNDYLTLKFANNHDIWMHTKNIPGSHVIVKNFQGNVSEKTLEEAASLAAFYSKSKDSTKVPVDYTEVKNVHKPNGAKPGMVIYYTNKTIFIDPKEPDLKQM
ncbi:NFACT RNA binding domain-containing protein [Clostridium sp. Marseille-Q2269]|uniref:Rqc2 family fibronectin-binding protein n=1 Tax=Clostridium sp. Marseille-Q2269 TaxID=2942205 RepID=UPI0020733376|nr:NFACT RNA binding domain-containing protein [Clostridium sp. Marseille-Q2269]